LNPGPEPHLISGAGSKKFMNMFNKGEIPEGVSSSDRQGHTENTFPHGGKKSLFIVNMTVNKSDNPFILHLN
jgi:hypothetical protein